MLKRGSRRGWAGRGTGERRLLAKLTVGERGWRNDKIAKSGVGERGENGWPEAQSKHESLGHKSLLSSWDDINLLLSCDDTRRSPLARLRTDRIALQRVVLFKTLLWPGGLHLSSFAWVPLHILFLPCNLPCWDRIRSLTRRRENFLEVGSRKHNSEEGAEAASPLSRAKLSTRYTCTCGLGTRERQVLPRKSLSLSPQHRGMGVLISTFIWFPRSISALNRVRKIKPEGTTHPIMQ